MFLASPSASVRKQSLALALVAIPLFTGPKVRAGFQDDIGFIKLKQELGARTPDGTNVALTMVEAIAGGSWAPEMRDELAGKSLRYTSGVSGYTTHAYEVGAYLVGSGRSIVPQVAGFEASNRSFYAYTSLWAGSSFFPAPATWDIENHSWGGDFGIDNTQIIQRMDYRVNRDAVVIVAGIDNGSTSKLSPVVANFYNGIAVGVSNGAHTRTGSTLDGAGRQKPDLVAPAGATSFATPMVASSAAVLVSEIKRTPSLSAARHPAAIKALLLAGATKEEFSTWTNTPTQPLDKVYGAGELNIFNSYKILAAGRTVAGGAAVSGWDVATTAASGGSRTYFVDVPAGQTLTLSAALVWHREILATGTNWNTSAGARYSGTSYAIMAVKLPNLDLVLRRVDTTPASEVTRSAGKVDNVEHLFRRALPAGRYALDVQGDAADATFALAWQGQLAGAPTPPVVVPPAEPVVPTNPPVSEASPLTALNVGAVGVAGVLDYDGVARDYVMAGAGAGMTGWSDAFYYASQASTATTTAVVRVDAFGGGGGARAGLSLRNSNDLKATHASVLVSTGGTVTLVRRTTSTSQVMNTVSAGPLPVWLKLARSASTVTASYSRDGVTWTQVGAATASFTSTGRIGLAVSSGGTTGAATAEFSGYRAQ